MATFVSFGPQCINLDHVAAINDLGDRIEIKGTNHSVLSIQDAATVAALRAYLAAGTVIGPANKWTTTDPPSQSGPVYWNTPDSPPGTDGGEQQQDPATP